MTEVRPRALCFGRSHSVEFNKVDAPIELKPRSLSRGRSVLNKSALKPPKDWSSPSPRRAVAMDLTGINRRDDLSVTADDTEENSSGIIHPPSLHVADVLAPTGREECDPDKASASWYKEAPRPRTTRYPIKPTDRKKEVVSISQLEIEERFRRSRRSVATILSNTTPVETDDSTFEISVPCRTREMERELSSLTVDDSSQSADEPKALTPSHLRSQASSSIWDQIHSVAAEIGNTF